MCCVVDTVVKCLIIAAWCFVVRCGVVLRSILWCGAVCYVLWQSLMIHGSRSDIMGRAVLLGVILYLLSTDKP